MSRNDGRRHDSMGVYRSRQATKALKSAVLDAWASGDTAIDIGALHGITIDYVGAIVQRARRAGDERAVRRPRYVLPPAGGRTRRRLALSVAS